MMRQTLIALLLACTGVAHAGPNIQTWTTAGGTPVLFVAAPEPALLDVRVVFDAGSARDGARAGLARLTSSLLFEGADDLDADAVAAGFENLGARYGAQSHRDMAVVSLRTLTEPAKLDAAVDLLARVLARPRFPVEAVTREGRAMEVGLAQQAQNPGSVGSKAFYAALYGDHPYASWPDGTPESVRALDRATVVGFHRRYYVAGNAVLVLVGAISREQAQALAGRLTAELPAGQAAPDLPEVVPAAPGARDIAFDSAQTHVLVGMPLLTRDDPDYFALLVGNHTLGGNGLVARISRVIREERGLAYSAYSRLSPMRRSGPLLIGLQTRADQADAATALVREELARFVSDGPTAEELREAQAQLAGSFPLRVDSNAEIADTLAMMGFYRLPTDWLDRYPERVRAVTLAEVKDAFARRVDPAALVQVRVGAHGNAKPTP